MSCWLLQRKFLPGDVSWEHVFDSGALHGSATRHFSSNWIELAATNCLSSAATLTSAHRQPIKGRRGEKMLKRVREQIPRQPLKEPVERTQQRVTSCACVRETAPRELPSLLLGFLPIKTPFKRSPSFSVCPVGICSYFFVSFLRFWSDCCRELEFSASVWGPCWLTSQWKGDKLPLPTAWSSFSSLIRWLLPAICRGHEMPGTCAFTLWTLITFKPMPVDIGNMFPPELSDFRAHLFIK